MNVSDTDMYEALANNARVDSNGKQIADIGSGTRRQSRGSAQRKLRRILDAADLRESNGFDDLWNDMLKIYSSRYDYPELGSYMDVVAPNLAFSTVNIIVPSIAMNNPKIMVSPRSPEQSMAATIAEVVVNYQWDAYKIGEEFRLAAKDFSIFGHGWLKTTWEYETKSRPMDPQEWQQEVDFLLSQREEAIMAGIPVDDLPSVEEVIESIGDTTEDVVKDQPIVLRVSPFDVFVDPDATSFRDIRWIAHRMIVPLAVAQRDKRWKQSQRAKLSPVSVSRARSTVDDASEIEMSNDAEFAEIYELYDLVDNTVCTIGVGCDNYLLDPVDIPFSFGHPFVFVPNYIVPERFYPIGDIESIFNLQVELATTRTQMVNDRKRFRRVYLYKPEHLEPDSLQKFRDGDDEVMIEVLAQIPFSEVMAPLASSPLPAEFYNQSDMITQDINVVSGVNEYQRGVAQPIRRTATEAAMMADSANARSAEKLNRIETAAAQVAYNLISLNQQFLEGEHIARIFGDDGRTSWVEYSSDALAGGFDFKVEPGSSMPNDDSMKQQKTLQLLDVTMPFMGQVIDPRAMAEHVLRQFGIRDTDRFIMEQQPMPQQGAPGEQPPRQAPPEGQGAPQGEEQPPPPEAVQAMMQDMMALGGEGGMPPGGGMPAEGGMVPPEML